MLGIEGVESVEFRPGLPNTKAPVNDGSGFVSLPLQGIHFPAEGFLVGEPLPEATAVTQNTRAKPKSRNLTQNR